MALMFPWATKEYLLWEMTIGQIILYHNKGMELKYGPEKAEPPGMNDMNIDDLKALRDDARKQFAAEKSREELQAQYGDIE